MRSRAGSREREIKKDQEREKTKEKERDAHYLRIFVEGLEGLKNVYVRDQGMQ